MGSWSGVWARVGVSPRAVERSRRKVGAVSVGGQRRTWSSRLGVVVAVAVLASVLPVFTPDGAEPAGASPSLLSLADEIDADDPLVHYRFDETGSASPGATLSVSVRTVSDGSRYYLDIPTDSTTATVRRFNNPTTTNLGTFTLPPLTVGAKRSVHIAHEGSDLEVTVWDPATGPRPATPSLTVTDSAITGPGFVRLQLSRNTGANSVLIDDYTEHDPSTPLAPVSEFTYDADGRPLTQTLPDGSRTWTYTDGRVATDTQIRNSSTKTYTYTYNPAGDIASVYGSGAGFTTNYTYDTAGQLTRAAATTDMRWAYDALGRRTTETNHTTGATATYGYDAASQLTTINPHHRHGHDALL